MTHFHLLLTTAAYLSEAGLHPRAGFRIGILSFWFAHTTPKTARYFGKTYSTMQEREEDEVTVEKHRATFWEQPGASLAYVKLHGSSNWRSRFGDNALVIGKNKAELLTREPLLRWYFSLFEKVLHERDRNLLTIGYSFRDPHINEVILSAVTKAGLKLFIVDRKSPDDFYQSMHDQRTMYRTYSREIWDAMHAYYSGSVIDYYFPTVTDLPAQGRALFSDLGLPLEGAPGTRWKPDD